MRVLGAAEIAGDDQQAEHGREPHGAAGDRRHRRLADAAAQQEAVQEGAQERQDGNDPEQSFDSVHRVPIP